MSSLAEVDGRPAISSTVKPATAGAQLSYRIATDATGTGWHKAVEIAEVGIAGRWHSLAVVEGAPAIAYIDSSSSKPALHFVRATNASGSGWGSPLELTERIDNFPHLLTLSRLVSIRGNPAVSFTRRNAPTGPSATSLAYLRARDARGTNWPPPVETGTSGWYMSLAELGNGRAAISFSNPTLEFVTSAASEEQVGINWIAVEP